VALTTNSDIDTLQSQIKEFKPKFVAVKNSDKARHLRSTLNSSVEVLQESEGTQRIAALSDVDIVVVAISGAEALLPLLNALDSKKRVCLANKEALVMAGGIVMGKVKQNKILLIPIDSEQSAIFQCLNSRNAKEVRQIYLTASGGPLNNLSKRSFKDLRPSDVLKHPRWKMGRKITVDSATLMNKGLEVIEARWLFNIGIEKIKVIVHKEAVVHSLVEFVDGAILAQLGITDMRLPIQYALTYPKRMKSFNNNLDLIKLGKLHFDKPDTEKFPCLELSYEAAYKGGSAPCVLNAANEIAVEAFLNGQINFTFIPIIVEKLLKKHSVIKSPTLKQIMATDAWAREEALALVRLRRSLN
jgi:1-deoxy-D-xylulose-5-phosphate reductoisomerase